MKNLLLLFGLISLGIFAQAQLQRKCGFDVVQNRIAQHPNYAEYQEQKQLTYKTFTPQKMDTVIRIPVVVHVIYRLASENISTPQINSQLAVLNKDYRKLNADTTNAAGWSKTDVKFEFVLAKKDPNGNPTNGITRTSTTIDDICGSSRYATVRPAWNRDRYLNIWVCDIDDFTLGFAYPPGAPNVSADEDGVVIGPEYFGTTGTAQAPYNLGRTTTHEIGHFFDLLHVWGNDNNPSCNTDDGVSDTPNQDDVEYDNCGARTSCGSRDQMSNFLQYVDDACMGNFTLGQKTRMRTALYTQRDSLQFGDFLRLTSIDERLLASALNIYPNPSQGVYRIELEDMGSTELFEVEVFRATGQKISVETKRTPSGLLLNMETAPNGVYFVRLTKDEFSSTKKLIKH